MFINGIHQLSLSFYYKQILHKQVLVLFLVTGKCVTDTYATDEMYMKMLEYFFKVMSCLKQTAAADCNGVETASPNDGPFYNPRVPPSHMSHLQNF